MEPPEIPEPLLTRVVRAHRHWLQMPTHRPPTIVELDDARFIIAALKDEGVKLTAELDDDLTASEEGD
jgi:hypothetical protein